MVNVAILSNLSNDEADAVLRTAARRFPAIVLAVRETSRESEELGGAEYEVVADDKDVEMFGDVIDAIVAEGRPLRHRVRDVESEIARIVTEMLSSRSFEYGRGPDTPMCALCLILEYQIVPLLLPFGDFVDGFLPSSVQPSERGVVLSGRCFFLPKAIDGGPFVAELALNDAGELSTFDMQFGDVEIARAEGFLCEQMNDVTYAETAGYQLTMRKEAADDGEDTSYAFRILKT